MSKIYIHSYSGPYNFFLYYTLYYIVGNKLYAIVQQKYSMQHK